MFHKSWDLAAKIKNRVACASEQIRSGPGMDDDCNDDASSPTKGKISSCTGSARDRCHTRVWNHCLKRSWARF